MTGQSKNSKIHLLKVELSNLTCFIFDTPLGGGTGSYSTSLESSQIWYR